MKVLSTQKMFWISICATLWLCYYLSGVWFLLKSTKSTHDKEPQQSNRVIPKVYQFLDHPTNYEAIFYFIVCGNSQLVQQIMKKATEHFVNDACGKSAEFSDDHESSYEHGRLMLNGALYYCNIPKCASSFLKLFLKRIFSKTNNSSLTENFDFDIKNFGIEIKDKRTLSNAYTFMFVRNPYVRLFSAYENKLFHPNQMWRGLGTDIIREVRPSASSLSQQLGYDVTFLEVIKYVLKLQKQGKEINNHLAAMNTLCNPCKQKFDFVGKLETMAHDLLYLVQELKVIGLVPKYLESVKTIESELKHKRSLGRIGKLFWALNEYNDLISRYELFQRNWSSYQMRGMILSKYKMPFHITNTSYIKQTVYNAAVESAINASKQYKNELKLQHLEAILQAYRTVPNNYMEKLSKYVEMDCLLFNYENKPSIFFNTSVLTVDLKPDYFQWI